VVSAPSDRKEELLKELERFAFRGIPNLTSPRSQKSEDDGDGVYSEGTEVLYKYFFCTFKTMPIR
jgi:hypothetical protein